ncbi:MAG: hypothetical protein M1416_02215 [Candidatus Pacearchaeota archaeon]|nr:hypothetical protein [Candidatus Pacearchaeota archaeon]
MLKKRFICLAFFFILAVSVFVFAVVDKTNRWHSSTADITLLIDSSEKTLQTAIDSGLLFGSHTYSVSSSSPAGGHNADKIWVSVQDGEMNLIQALTSSNSLCPANPLIIQYTGPADKSNAYHYATEIEVTISDSPMSLQDAIDSGELCYSWENWIQKLAIAKEWRGVAMSSDGRYQTVGGGGGSYPFRLYVSNNSGNNWTGKSIDEHWTDVAMSSDGRYQTAVAGLSGKIYVSSDYGNSWTQKYDSTFILIKVAMSSNGQYQTAIAGGGSSGRVYISSNYGNTWTEKSQDKFSGIAMSSDGTIRAAVSTSTTHGIYVSTDSGNTWTLKYNNWPATEYLTSITMSSDGRYQTAAVGTPTATGKIYISSDYGNTWTPKEENRNWLAVDMSSDGKIQTAVNEGSQYTSPGRIYISTDYGNTWTPKADNRYWYDVAISSDGAIQTAVVYSGTVYVSYGD